MLSEDIKLGMELKDSITGFAGVAINRTEWLNGCVRIGIQPRELHEGKPIEYQVFDVQQLELVAGGFLDEKASKVSRSGGDRPTIKRATDPR
jgi:hypothetical protein